MNSDSDDSGEGHLQSHDLFLDFLNRDARQIYGVYAALGREQHIGMLRRLLNVAVFHCRDRCIMPPGFASEDRYVREVMRVADAYLDSKLVQWPMRETLDEYWEKKEREYAMMRDEYSELFSAEAQSFVIANSHLIIGRSSKIGRQLVDQWERAPDENQFWRTRSTFTPANVVEFLRKVPRTIYEQGEAVTWAAIQAQVEELANHHPEYRELVQNIYFGIYIEEFDLRVLARSPMAKIGFGQDSGELFYDYPSLQLAVEVSGLWSTLENLSSWDIARLRREPEYFEFRRLFWILASQSNSHYDLRLALAVSASDLEDVRLSTEILDRTSVDQLSLQLDHRTDEWIEAFARRLSGSLRVPYERAMAERDFRIRGQERLRETRALLRSTEGDGSRQTIATAATRRPVVSPE